MKLIFLGTGAALLQKKTNFQSNMLLVDDQGKKLLIDCGTDIRFSLEEQKIHFNEIAAVYISHLHADHFGGLEWLGFNFKFNDKTKKPELFISEDLVHTLWDHCLSGSMHALPNKTVTLETYFNLQPIKQCFFWGNAKFNLIKTIHVKENKKYVPSYGLLINYKDKKYLITTDTQFKYDYFARFYEEADLIFHDCETQEPASGVHAHYTQLITLDSKIKKKLWLYHYNETKLPDAYKDGFIGFIKKGQVFEL